MSLDSLNLEIDQFLVCHYNRASLFKRDLLFGLSATPCPTAFHQFPYRPDLAQNTSPIWGASWQLFSHFRSGQTVAQSDYLFSGVVQKLSLLD